MQKSHNIWQVSHIPSPSPIAFKPETMITNMPRASKSTKGRKKLEEYLKENPQKKKRGDSECW